MNNKSILRLKEIIKRYGRLEIIALLFALSFAKITYLYTRSYVSAAVAGTLGDMIGFYGCASLRQYLRLYKKHKSPGSRKHFRMLYLTMWAILCEHGIAGVLDDFIIRPFSLWVMPQLVVFLVNQLVSWGIRAGTMLTLYFGFVLGQMPNFEIGIILGKFVADFIFYRISLESMDRLKHHIK